MARLLSSKARYRFRQWLRRKNRGARQYSALIQAVGVSVAACAFVAGAIYTTLTYRLVRLNESAERERLAPSLALAFSDDKMAVRIEAENRAVVLQHVEVATPNFTWRIDSPFEWKLRELLPRLQADYTPPHEGYQAFDEVLFPICVVASYEELGQHHEDASLFDFRYLVLGNGPYNLQPEGFAFGRWFERRRDCEAERDRAYRTRQPTNVQQPRTGPPPW